MQTFLENLEKYILYSIIFFVPFAFAPISSNIVVPIKLIILVYGLGLALIVKVSRTIITGRFTWATSRFDIPVFIIGVAYLLSTIFRTPNKMEAILLPGTTTTVIGSVVLYFMVNQLSKKAKEGISSILIASGVVFALLVLLSGIGLFGSLSFLPDFMKSNFTPAGGFLPSAIFLFLALVIAVGKALTDTKVTQKALWAISGVIMLFALGLSIFKLTPGQNNIYALRLPSYNTSWAIAVDSLKTSPLLGIGSGNYLTAFNRFRPIEQARSDQWEVKFSTANSFYLTLFTETGMLGFAGLTLLLVTFFKLLKSEVIKLSKEGNLQSFFSHTQLISVTVLLLALFFLPASTIVIIIAFTLLASSFPSTQSDLMLATRAHSDEPITTSKVPSLIISLPIIVAVLYIFIKGAPIVSAEYKFKQAITAATTPNQGGVAYSKIQDAIRVNPYVDRYRAFYAQVNLNLANNALQNILQKSQDAAQTEGQTVQITEDERSQLASLIQQAIREARATVILNPSRADNWQLLAGTYRAVIPLAKGADIFSSQSYAQAIALDPYNPNLRIARGQLHFAAKDYKSAVDLFTQASAIRPTLANARYNLAFALKESGDIEGAISQLTQVMSLVDKQSSDYETARAALTELEKEKSLNASQATDSENLNPPQVADEPAIDPQVELTDEEAPPEADDEATPTPTPDELEEATPTQTLTTTPTPAT